MILNFCDTDIPAHSDFNKTGGLGSLTLQHTTIKRKQDIKSELIFSLHIFQHIYESKSAVITRHAIRSIPNCFSYTLINHTINMLGFSHMLEGQNLLFEEETELLFYLMYITAA